MTLKIGDDIIMTVDSGKGEIQHNLQNGNYKGVISSIDENDLSIEATLLNGYKFWFDANRRCIGLSGMSIRPAYPTKEFAKEVDSTQVRPSQWIEGHVPDKYAGDALVCDESRTQKSLIYCANGLHDTRLSFKIAYHFLIPPPPPVKEVEAFGYLKWDEMYDNGGIDYDKACRTEARAFYSQSATAEVLINCFKGNCAELLYKATIDEYIAYAKTSGAKLLFTPTALDILGVR